MKYLSFILIFCFTILLSGCFEPEDNSKTLSFWTDKELAIEEYNMLFANEVHVGDFNEVLEDPICNDLKLLNFKISESKDLLLSVRNAEGESIEIAEINLFSVSTGIKIKPTERGQIFVDQTLDDICTLIYINWKD
jgi:hypothetical protein